LGNTLVLFDLSDYVVGELVKPIIPLIFCATDFKLDAQVPNHPRSGALIEAAYLQKELLDFNISTELLHNKSVAEFNTDLQKFAQKDWSKHDCLVAIISTHGVEGGFWATDNLIPLSYVCDAFSPTSCPGLKGKPKILIVQACRPFHLLGSQATPNPVVGVQADSIPKRTEPMLLTADHEFLHRLCDHTWENSIPYR